MYSTAQLWRKDSSSKLRKIEDGTGDFFIFFKNSGGGGVEKNRDDFPVLN